MTSYAEEFIEQHAKEFGQNFTNYKIYTKPRIGVEESGVDAKLVRGKWRYEITLPENPPDFAVYEEFKHLRDLVKRFGPNGAEEYGKVQVSAFQAEKELKKAGVDGLVEWAKQSDTNLQSVKDLLWMREGEISAKNWVLKSSDLKSKYPIPDDWLKVQQEFVNSSKDYRQELRELRKAKKLLGF